jgi:integrase-like protein
LTCRGSSKSRCVSGGRQQRRAWLAVGRPFPEWVFASVTGTALDEANVRKSFNRILDAAGLDRRGPHQMRHTFASLLLQDGAPITYVSRQLGHKDASITLRVYAHWLPDATHANLVDGLDDAALDGPQAAPRIGDVDQELLLSRFNSEVSLTLPSWNLIGDFLRRLDALKRAA